MNVLADAIYQHRLRRGWSQGQLAAKAGMTRQTVGSIERGKPTAEIDGVLALLAALDLTVTVTPRRVFASDADYLSHLRSGDTR